MSKYAVETTVSVEKSRAELETILRRYGAVAFGYMTDDRKAAVQFVANGKSCRFILPVPDITEFTTYMSRGYRYRRVETAARGAWEQACRSRWRSLVLCVKAKLEAVSAGITTFETEFMAHIVLPNGQTIGERFLPEIETALTNGRMPEMRLTLPES